jgi:flagellar hook-length control protein FliK
MPIAASAPASAPASASAPAAPHVPAPGTAAANPGTDPASLARQLGGRLAAAATLGTGHHVLSVPVDPEHLGPVRIVAHITPDAVRLHLAGTSGASHEALTASLDDLRRDLAQHGLNAEVDVDAGSGRGAQADTGWSRDGTDRAPTRARGPEPGTPARATPGAAAPGRAPVPSGAGRLDLVL